MRADAAFVDDRGQKWAIPPGYSTEVTMRKLEQLDQDIWPVMKKAMEQVVAFSGGTILNTTFGTELQNLDNAIHGLRYHQRQFLYRLSILTADHTLYFEPAQGNVTVFLDDMPLRYELEAFLFRVRTCLDLLARVLSICLGKSPRKFGEFQKLLHSATGIDAGMRGRLLAVFGGHSDWIKECSALRNAVVHEATFSEFRGFGYRNAQLLAPTIRTLSADHICFRVWRAILQMTAESFDAITWRENPVG